MNLIDSQPMSQAFYKCWHAAATHLQNMGQGSLNWLRAHPYPPYLSHLSFRVGNQLFFIFIQDVNEEIFGPDIATGLHSEADACQGWSCFLPMRKINGEWTPATPDWGLIDTKTGGAINPVSLVSEQKIRMTDWELQDFAVQIVRADLEKQGRKVTSHHGAPDIHPSIWFDSDSGPEWVVVRAARYPQKTALLPEDIGENYEIYNRRGQGHFGQVVIANSEDPFDPQAIATGNFLPVLRGHPLSTQFSGLVTIEEAMRQNSPPTSNHGS